MIYKTRYKSILLVVFFCFFWSNPAYAAAPAITAEAAILMDGRTGEILYSKNAFEQRAPASLTKVMTAMLALSIGDIESVAVVSNKAAATGESRINLIAGEKITLENLLFGALLKSGNDACVAIAENVCDSEAEFVALMNLKAQLIGCGQTHFTNTNGLPDPKHYTCAYNLALMTRVALQDTKFREIVSTPYKKLEWVGSRQVLVKNTNRLLQFYPGAIGVKTGTTNAAGQCLIAAAEQNERCLIAVVLKSKNRFLDSTLLLDYGFKNAAKSAG